MIQYREISIYIDSSKGTLVSADGAKINREDLLPRLILADEVILYAAFLNITEDDGIIKTEPKSFDSSMNFRIIGDCDRDNSTHVMFAGDFIAEKSDIANGIAAFHIDSNSTRFAEALQNSNSKKGEFVILAKYADPITSVVLAKDSFIAENRPCENADFTEVEIDEIVTKNELQLLLDLKSPLKHTHCTADITDLELSEPQTYSAGTGISIENGVISCTIEPGGGTGYTAGEGLSLNGTAFSVDFETVAKKTDIVNYSAGSGISISADNVISCTVEPGGGNTYYAGEGLSLTGTAFSVDWTVVAKQADLAVLQQTIGDIGSILDAINGEVI